MSDLFSTSAASNKHRGSNEEQLAGLGREEFEKMKKRDPVRGELAL